MTERWLPIPGVDGYQASSAGRVRSPRGVRTPYQSPAGYLTVSVSLNGTRRTYSVHRLVALAFAGRPPSASHEVCHADGDRTNNTPQNLRWGTRAENMRDAVSHQTHYQSAKTHCPSGHAYTDANTYVYRGRRNCRACKKERQS